MSERQSEYETEERFLSDIERMATLPTSLGYYPLKNGTVGIQPDSLKRLIEMARRQRKVMLVTEPQITVGPSAYADWPPHEKGDGDGKETFAAMKIGVSARRSPSTRQLHLTTRISEGLIDDMSDTELAKIIGNLSASAAKAELHREREKAPKLDPARLPA